MADIAASVLAKLRNKAKAAGISHQQCLQLFMQEEFLRKLSKSGLKKFLVLKGDVIVPHAMEQKIQTQLPDFEAPVIFTYSLESTIAEKFDAILQRFELTGRMKDFYDIYYLARTFDFDGAKLQAAIFETLQRRGTHYDRNSFKRVVSLAEDMDMQKRWKYFLKTIKDDTLEFSVVIEEIQKFLEPVFEAIVGEGEWQREWESNISRWSHLGGGIDHNKSS